MKVPIEKRFWIKVDRSGGPDACWIFTTQRGRPTTFLDGKLRRASQVAWEIQNKASFPKGMFACHSCDNDRCVNPKHIFVGTQFDNMKDARSKGRLKLPHERGFKPHNALKTHCLKGHPLSGDNLYVIPSTGGRVCRTCAKAKHKRYAKGEL